jgi:arylsulfatase A-like enzyme
MWRGISTVLICLELFAAGSFAADRPNIIYVLCDDLGYGDISSFHPAGKIATPAFDRLAREGMRFTDAHSGSAVCTPTRYGLLTGRYAWRSRLQQGVLGGLSPRLIEQERLTVPEFLRQQGYHTACIGKWHLGLDWVKLPGKEVTELSIESPQQVNNVDYSQPFSNGPLAVGFDTFFGISASLDMVPYTFLNQDRVLALPTEQRDFSMMLGSEQGRTRTGPAAPEFDAATVLPELTARSEQYLREQASAARNGRPFFLYLPLASPHTPILPTAAWQGKSGLNHYADFVQETDASIGRLLDVLDELELSEHTLFIATSDNGCSPQADYPELLKLGHNPSGDWRGTKADIYEGGHRVPFVARWPGRVAPGSTCAETICLTDLLATCAEILEVSLPDNSGEDSVSLLPALLGRNTGPLREGTVHHSINGSFAIRAGVWKLCLCPGSGGWSTPRPNRDNTDQLPGVQLFNLQDDPAEQRNLAGSEPGKVAELTALLQDYISRGRSTPGTVQPNAVPIELFKERQTARRGGAGSSGN